MGSCQLLIKLSTSMKISDRHISLDPGLFFDFSTCAHC